MFEKLCIKFCLHTRAARIAFFSSIFFITSITVLAALYLYEPQAIIPPPAIRNFQAQELAEEFRQEFGVTEGDALFALVRTHTVFGDAVLQQYVFLRRKQGSNRTMTAREAAAAFAEEQQRWQAVAPKLAAASSPMVNAVGEDLTEAQQLAKDGLTRWAPLINQSMFKARSMFHDLAKVLLAEEKSGQYYGDTRLGRLLEKRASR
ncbi:MAG: hypothetical protein KGZ41_05105 [Dethiobacter sp.]|nr:hypothetical protein [Dethiobacter sp.]MBS3897565.1 hypothetical protein [Dethiobacter sp.]MBS3983157.1 hypothetical protein [Dethiobacter sp.]